MKTLAPRPSLNAILPLAALLVALSPAFVACSAGTKAGCVINGDCAKGQQCVSGKCVAPPTACVADSECPEGNSCLSGVCQPTPAPTGCETDDDCSATPATPLCLRTKVCGECRTTVDCGDSMKQCSDQHACVFAPGYCAVDADCALPSLATTPNCDTSTHECVGCVSDDQCPSGYYCSQITQACSLQPTHHCASDSECSAPTSHCETASGICQQCTGNTQCASGQTCQNGSCVTGNGGCTGDYDCPNATPVCDTNSGACVVCVTNGQCSNQQTCVNNVCVNACSRDSECSNNPAGHYCVTGQCVECRSSTNCGSNQTCVSNTCITNTPTGCTTDNECLGNPAGAHCSAGDCVQCVFSSDCGSQQTCVSNVCISTGGGATSCTATGDCASQLSNTLCDTVAGYCVACVSDSDCSTSEFCDLGVCAPNPVCNSNASCHGLDCNAFGQCVRCIDDSECDAQWCINGQCVQSPLSVELGCGELWDCRNTTVGFARDNCRVAASFDALDMYDALLACRQAACDSDCNLSSSACSSCLRDTISSGGACYSEAVACSLDR